MQKRIEIPGHLCDQIEAERRKVGNSFSATVRVILASHFQNKSRSFSDDKIISEVFSRK